MKTKDKRKVQDLGKIIAEYMASGKSLADFRNEHMFKDYAEFGDEKLREIASQYFLDHLK